jgi:hypothetical protein
MLKSVLVLTFGISLGCVGGSTTCIESGTELAITRTDPTGNCGSDVVAGVMALNQTLTPQKDFPCGVDHFSTNSTFTQESGSGASCQGSNAITIPELGSDGGSGTDVMTITCTSGVSCTETFDVTLIPG